MSSSVLTDDRYLEKAHFTSPAEASKKLSGVPTPNIDVYTSEKAAESGKHINTADVTHTNIPGYGNAGRPSKAKSDSSSCLTNTFGVKGQRGER